MLDSISVPSPYLIGVTVAVLLATAGALWPLRAYLSRKMILDHPNERSSHSVPVPKGGGLIVVPAIIAGWYVMSTWAEVTPPDIPSMFLANRPDSGSILIIGGLALVIWIVSWIDDLRHLPALPRLILHFIAAGIGYWLLPISDPILAGWVPRYVEAALVVTAWVWFINLFNFMDGIDGISASQLITSNIGIVLLGTLAPQLAYMTPYALVVIAASAGFLIWNWPPARIFLGDVGSAPLGFLLGWQIISLANAGATVAAVIVVGYHLSDATITLLLRLFRGEKIWTPHRDHFFQVPIRNGASHLRVSVTVFAAGLMLSAIALLSVMGQTILSIFLAVTVVALTLWHFARHPDRSQTSKAEP